MDLQILAPILTAAATLVGAGIGFAVTRRTAASAVAEAERRAETLLEATRKEAETLKKAAIVEGKEALRDDEEKSRENIRKAEDQAREREKKLDQREQEQTAARQRLERREEDLDRRAQSLEDRLDNVEKTRAEIEAARAELDNRTARLEERAGELERTLEQAANMTVEEARAKLFERVEETAREEAAKIQRQLEEDAKANADEVAKKVVTDAVQRYSGEYVAERTVTVVPIPDDQMKGRIIGREGRNIRAFEMITGVDLIVDDTPESVVISCHNPLRREVARQTLDKLLEDGRIQPTRIEEIFQQVSQETEKTIFNAGQDAVFDLGLQKLHPELVRLMGINKFRTSYSQNILLHSQEVSYICGMLADEIGIDANLARRCGFLHDIGKAVDQEFEGGHATIGGELCKKFGEDEAVVKAVAEHHDDPPSTIYGVLVQAADTLSAARPGARRESVTNYVKRLEELEEIANRHPEVNKAFAIQAGREVRIIVDAERSDDGASYQLAKTVAAEIEHQMKYPGQIKVTVLRETRAVAYAK